jgi:anti-sigma factor RsiW
MALVERELGLLTLGFERGLDEHLAGCADCREHAAKEQALVAGLMALRGQATPAVEVRQRVMREVRSLPRAEPGWVRQRQLAWASAAAIAAAIGLVAWIWPRAAWLREAAASGADGTRALLSAAYSTLAALKSLLVLPWRVLSALVEALAPMLDTLGRLEPIAITAITLGLVSMTLMIAWVVGNDLRRPDTIAWRKEE